MIRKDSKRFVVDILFVLTLFSVFAISMVFLLATGSNVYKNIVNNIGVNYDERTSEAYIINKLRQGDVGGNIKIGKFHDLNAVIIEEEVDNIIFSTYLYYDDGFIKELYTRQSLDFDPDLGDNIIPAKGFSMEQISDTLYSFTILTENGKEEKLFVHVRSSK